MLIALDRHGLDLRPGALLPRAITRGRDRARVAIIAGGALLIGGDAIDVAVRVGRGCVLELEDIGGMVGYGGNGRTATWQVSITVEAGGMLIWHTLPFIVADEAGVHRETDVDIARGGAVLLRETFVMGRAGERGGSLRARTDVVRDGRRLFREDLALAGTDPLPGILGGHRVMDTAFSLGMRQDSGRQLAGEGSYLRAVGDHAHIATVDTTWTSWVAGSTPMNSPDRKDLAHARA